MNYDKLKKEKLFKGKKFDVSRYYFNISNKKILHEIVEQNSASAVLAIENDCIIMVKQFRHPFDEVLEIPAGIKNTDRGRLIYLPTELQLSSSILWQNLEDGIENSETLYMAVLVHPTVWLWKKLILNYQVPIVQLQLVQECQQ